MFGSLGSGFASADCKVGKYGVLVQNLESSLVYIFYGWCFVLADGGIANAKFIEDVMLQLTGQPFPKELVLISLGYIFPHIVATCGRGGVVVRLLDDTLPARDMNLDSRNRVLAILLEHR